MGGMKDHLMYIYAVLCKEYENQKDY